MATQPLNPRVKGPVITAEGEILGQGLTQEQFRKYARTGEFAPPPPPPPPDQSR